MKKIWSSLILMLFYTVIIITFGMFVYSVASRIGGVNVGDYLFGAITVIFILNFILIGFRQRKSVKKLDYEDKKKFMMKQVNTLYILITITAISLIMCVIYRLKTGMLVSMLFMAAFGFWELGACLGYKNLVKSNNHA